MCAVDGFEKVSVYLTYGLTQAAGRCEQYLVLRSRAQQSSQLLSHKRVLISRLDKTIHRPPARKQRVYVLLHHPMSLLHKWLMIRLWLGKKLYCAYGQFVVRVSRDSIIKGPCELSEVEAMRYVAQHTSIPIPKVVRTYRVGDNKLFIKMKFVRGGINLQEAWLGEKLSTQQKEEIVTQLAGFVKQLRDLQPPQQKQLVGSVGSRACLDHRIGSSPVGPFTDHDEFHSFLRRDVPLDDCTKVFGESVTLSHSRQYSSVFSHADLCPRNILVAGDKILAIIDWQFAGWWPEYWEYTKAHFGRMDMPEWYDKLGSVMIKYDEQLEAERALWRQCDQPGMPL